MARIRTIKPEFWTSEQIAECSPNARLLFIGLWSFSDDSGVHPASASRLKMEVFPADAFSRDDITRLVAELVEHKLVTEYEVDGERFWQVTGWKKHQKIDQPSYKYPLADGIVPGTPARRRKGGEQAPNDSRTDDERAPNVRRTQAECSEGVRCGNGEERNGIDLSTTQRESRSPPAREIPDRLFALSADFEIPKDWLTWGKQQRPDLSREELYAAAEKFRSHHASLSHAKRLAGWEAEWHKWAINERAVPYRRGPDGDSGRSFVVEGDTVVVRPNPRGEFDNEHVAIAKRLGVSSVGLPREQLEQKLLGKLRQLRETAHA